MRRRGFITLIGGATVWPLGARAQQRAVPVIGYLRASSSETIERSPTAFRKGLSETGFVEGRNVAFEYRAADNDYRRLPELAADLVRRRVAVIYASGGTVSARAAKAETTTIPIVFSIGDDPVALGLVASLNRPGGNVTGVAFLSTELGPKRLGLLKELVPGAARYAALVNPNAPATEAMTADLRAAAAAIGKEIEFFTASNIREIDAAFADLVRSGANALVVGGSSLFPDRSVQLATLAAHHRLPAIYYERRTVEVGGLMSYGANILDAIRQAGVYAGRILKGEKPADLPVSQAVKFEFVINLQTARTLGLTVPPGLLSIHPTDPVTGEAETRELQAAGRILGVRLVVLHASTERDLESVFATLVQMRAGGLVISTNTFFTSRSERLAALALRHAVPSIQSFHEFAAAGGLMSYGRSFTELYRVAGVYTGRILKGEKPADLPVQQSTKVELTINLKTAKALGLTVPLSLRARADEVIE
jgi:putative tryptophan/tyrosine transport system substrate-binding protein